MTKRDYILISGALAQAREEIDKTYHPLSEWNLAQRIGHKAVARRLALAMAARSSKFDVKQFMTDAGAL